MIHIKKGKIPKALIEYKIAKNSLYQDFPEKDSLRQSLLKEQHNLCAYCMGKIFENTMKIEHFKCQSTYPELQLDYNNMLGCCTGNEGKPHNQQTCDTFKGNLELLFSPANITDFQKMGLYYTDDGSIYSTNQAFNEQLNTVLNLNSNTLKNNRKDILDAVKYKLDSKPNLRSKEELEKFIRNYKDSPSPYYGIAIYYLEKKLAKRKSPHP